MDINTAFDKIESKESFEVFLDFFEKDYHENKNEWENVSLSDFLEAIKAYSKDLEGYYENMNLTFDKDKPTWKDFAQILMGAKVYE